MARPGPQPNAQIIGRLDLPFGATVMALRPALTGIREEWEVGLILTDPTVWTSKAWGALAAVPVIPIDAGSAVVAAGQKKRGLKLQFVSQDTPRLVLQTDTYPRCFYIKPFQAGIFSPVSIQ